MEQVQLIAPLSEVDHALLKTAEASHYLRRRPQTLRCWSAYENGPISPVRINGLLGWKTEDVRRLVAGLPVQRQPVPQRLSAPSRVAARTATHIGPIVSEPFVGVK